ncbi:MAG TPA: GAF domain-containing protein, partial [Thermoanaerobaculia bacterium]
MTQPDAVDTADIAGTARSRELEALNEIARTATLDLELRPMLQRITDTLLQKFGWPFVALASVDAEQEVFVCEALSTLLPSAVNVGYTRKLGTGVVGEVALKGEPILLDDVLASSNYVETMPGSRSELCVPVRHGGRIVAILNLESTEAGAFHDQLPLLQTVA